MWQDSTQVNYFGIGSNSIDADQSQYQLRTSMSSAMRRSGRTTG